MTITKAININCTADKAFDFIANLTNWTSYAIHNVLSINKNENGDWIMQTPRGPGKLVLYPNKSLGIFDHDFIDAGEGKWSVPARVVSTPYGCHLMMTFSKPDPMPNEMFEEGMRLLQEELSVLKKILEGH